MSVNRSSTVQQSDSSKNAEGRRHGIDWNVAETNTKIAPVAFVDHLQSPHVRSAGSSKRTRSRISLRGPASFSFRGGLQPAERSWRQPRAAQPGEPRGF